MIIWWNVETKTCLSLKWQATYVLLYRQYFHCYQIINIAENMYLTQFNIMILKFSLPILRDITYRNPWHKCHILLFVGGLMSYLRYLCVLAYSGVQHILGCVFVLFFVVLRTLCCQFLWLVHFWLPHRYSLTFI